VCCGGGTTCRGAGRGLQDAGLGWRQRRKGLVASLFCLAAGVIKSTPTARLLLLPLKFRTDKLRLCVPSLPLSSLTHVHAACMHSSSISVNLTCRTPHLSSCMQRQQRREGDGCTKFLSKPNSPKTRLFTDVSACTLHLFWSKFAACMGAQALHAFTPSFPFCILAAAGRTMCA
jgi:hypothetical protein